jgi:hypothetical protein
MIKSILSCTSVQILTGEVVVVKNPCLWPGDVRKLTTVDRPQLRHHVNTIVFSQKVSLATRECIVGSRRRQRQSQGSKKQAADESSCKNSMSSHLSNGFLNRLLFLLLLEAASWIENRPFL